MKVAVISDSASDPYYKKILESFAKGIDGQADIVHSSQYKNYDCAVIFGSYKPKRGRLAHKGKGVIIESGMPYIQLETQLVGRPIDTSHHKEFRVGVNGFLWDQAEWGFEHIKEDRATKVFERNGYDPLIKWKDNGNYILLCMQKVGDASLRGIDVFGWTAQTVKELRQHTDREIIIRPHPLYRKRVQHTILKEQLLKVKNVTWQESDLEQNQWSPVQQQLKESWCVVTYTSGTGIDAVLTGTPSIACNSGSMVYDVSSKAISDVEGPFKGDKSAWTNKIAHCQWSIEEFESGECWEHVSKSI